MTRCIATALAAGVLLASEQAGAQILDLSWRTIDGGGGTSAAAGFTLDGAIGQPDAGTLTGFGYEVAGGFWSVSATAVVCYANCDNSTAPPILNINDFQCFLNRFAAADALANCDNSTAPPTLNINDFQCFLNKFAVGCT